MVYGDTIISYEFQKSIEFEGRDIKINPKILLDDIVQDFEKFILELKTDRDSRQKFSDLFSNLSQSQ